MFFVAGPNAIIVVEILLKLVQGDISKIVKCYTYYDLDP